MAIWPSIRHVGSFQSGRVVRTGDALRSVWRSIERIGTIESVTRIVEANKHPPEIIKVATLRIRQAVELRRASIGASLLTRPLLLYYSALNLVRGTMLAATGSIGEIRHGLRYKPGPTPLDCGAQLDDKGTFPHFLRMMAPQHAASMEKRISLRDLLAAIPEVRTEFPLLGRGHSSVVRVDVLAMMDGDMFLNFDIPGETGETFKKDWASVLYWFADKCEPVESVPFRLRVKDRPKDRDAIRKICSDHLTPDLVRRDDPVWYDYWDRRNKFVLPPIPAYLATLFVLSNINRYEPEVLELATHEGTDLGYVLTTFLDSAERFFPQLVLQIFEGVLTYYE